MIQSPRSPSGIQRSDLAQQPAHPSTSFIGRERELATTRSNPLAPRAFLARPGHRLDVLSRGPRDVPSRQQALRLAIAASGDQLADARGWDRRTVGRSAGLSRFVSELSGTAGGL